MEKIRAGMIGCGGIANGKHMPAIRNVKEIELAAFCDLIPERAEKAAKDYGVEGAKCYADYRELLEDGSLDAVYVCTPNRSHSEIAVAALKAGKHVMCEKPMAINYTEAQKMVKAAKESGKILTIGYQNRYRQDSLYLKKECQSGALGDIYFGRAQAIRRRGVPTWGVFLNEYEQGGGPLIDIGTHALDLTLWCMDNYRPKYAVGSVFHKLNGQTEPGNMFGPWDPEKFTVEDSAFGYIVMENGAAIILESSWALNCLDVGEAITMLCGTKAGADMKDGLRINGVVHDAQFVTRPAFQAGGVDFYTGETADAPTLEQKTFANAVLGNGKLTVLPEQAAVVTRILDAIYESAKTGKPVYFD